MKRKTSDRIYGLVCGLLFGIFFYVFMIRAFLESVR